MKGLHGIIFSYERRNDLKELGEIRSSEVPSSQDLVHILFR